jgi:NCS2 family nucleobase:cation symporter-2
LLGFYNAIELVMETGFAVTAFLTVILNLIIPEEVEDEEIPELTAATVDDEADKAEWAYIRRKSAAARQGSDITPAVNGTDPEKSVGTEKKAGEAA